MYVIFAFARFVPLWATPVALVLIQIGIFFSRRKEKKLAISFFGTAFMIIVGAGLWIYFRGDLHSDEWVKRVLMQY